MTSRLLFFVVCQRTHFKTINRHNRNKWLKKSLVASAVNNFAEGYFLIPCFPLRQIRPHTFEFFLYLAEPWKHFLSLLKSQNLFIWSSCFLASSLMCLAVSKSTFPAVRCSFTETSNLQLMVEAVRVFSKSLPFQEWGITWNKNTSNFQQLLQKHS